MESVSSFIGVDGTNITQNAGRVLIELKPHGTRDSVGTVMERLKERVARQEGIALYMQPVQDLTIEDRVSRTQYQFTLESANPDDLRDLDRSHGRAHAHAAPARRRGLGPAGPGPAGLHHHRPRHAPAASA